MGVPNIDMKVDISPPRDFKATTLTDFMRLPMILTAMPAVARHAAKAGRCKATRDRRIDADILPLTR